MSRLVTMLERLKNDAVMSKFATQRDCQAYRQAVDDMLNMVRGEGWVLEGERGYVPSAFRPTHRHADGGLYRLVSEAKYKPLTLNWSDAIIYEAEDRKLYVTTPARWNDRFTPI